MAIYATPPKSAEILRRLEELDELRRYLAEHLGDSTHPWTGALRRLAAAEATVGSTSRNSPVSTPRAMIDAISRWRRVTTSSA